MDEHVQTKHGFFEYTCQSIVRRVLKKAEVEILSNERTKKDHSTIVDDAMKNCRRIVVQWPGVVPSRTERETRPHLKAHQILSLYSLVLGF